MGILQKQLGSVMNKSEQRKIKPKIQRAVGALERLQAPRQLGDQGRDAAMRVITESPWRNLSRPPPLDPSSVENSYTQLKPGSNFLKDAKVSLGRNPTARLKAGEESSTNLMPMPHYDPNRRREGTESEKGGDDMGGGGSRPPKSEINKVSPPSQTTAHSLWQRGSCQFTPRLFSPIQHPAHHTHTHTHTYRVHSEVYYQAKESFGQVDLFNCKRNERQQLYTNHTNHSNAWTTKDHWTFEKNH